MVKYSMLSSQYPILIIGLGKTGLSVARYLYRQNQVFAVCDTRLQPDNLADLKAEFPLTRVFCGELDEKLLIQAQQLIVSPGIPVATPAIAAAAQAGVEILGDVELFAQQAKAPIVAITGSNGKTTVTTLVGEMAKAAGIKVGIGGNIGTPVLDLLEGVYDLYVLELSSFQLETTTSLKATAAVSLNISDDHLDRYENLLAYAAAKLKIYTDAETAVLNLDDDLAWQGVNLTKKSIGFTLNPKVANEVQDITTIFTVKNGYIVCNNENWIALDDIKLAGKHHLSNILASFALGYGVNLPQAAMLKIAETFSGLPHRCQQIASYDEIIWINDSKATNVGAATVALESVADSITGKIILLAGGDGKNADFSPLSKPVTAYCRTVILFGKDAARLAAGLHPETKTLLVQDLITAVEKAQQFAQSGDAVLLSPACSSLDMFTNYMARGEQFSKAVTALYKPTNLEESLA